jgi:hypothetical protein
MSKEFMHSKLSNAVETAGLSAPELAMNLDRLKTLVQRVLISAQDSLEPETRNVLKAEVARLGEMLNPIFRPVDGDSLPSISSFTGVRIGYWADERGFVVSALDWVGRPFLRSYALDALMEPLGSIKPWEFDCPIPRKSPLDLSEIREVAIATARFLADLWDHPAQEPYVTNDPGLEKRLTELLQERDF